MSKFDFNWCKKAEFYLYKHEKGTSIWFFKSTVSAIDCFDVSCVVGPSKCTYTWRICYTQDEHSAQHSAMIYLDAALHVVKVQTSVNTYLHTRYTQAWERVFAPIIRQICIEYRDELQLMHVQIAEKVQKD